MVTLGCSSSDHLHVPRIVTAAAVGLGESGSVVEVPDDGAPAQLEEPTLVIRL